MNRFIALTAIVFTTGCYPIAATTKSTDDTGVGTGACEEPLLIDGDCRMAMCQLCPPDITSCSTYTDLSANLCAEGTPDEPAGAGCCYARTCTLPDSTTLDVIDCSMWSGIGDSGYQAPVFHDMTAFDPATGEQVGRYTNDWQGQCSTKADGPGADNLIAGVDLTQCTF